MPLGKATPESPASATRAMREGNEALAPDQASLDQRQDDALRGHGGVHHPGRADAQSMPGAPGRAPGAPDDAEPERGIEAPAGGGLARERGGASGEPPEQSPRR